MALHEMLNLCLIPDHFQKKQQWQKKIMYVLETIIGNTYVIGFG